jgi:hypothetical protein
MIRTIDAIDEAKDNIGEEAFTRPITGQSISKVVPQRNVSTVSKDFSMINYQEIWQPLALLYL